MRRVNSNALSKGLSGVSGKRVLRRQAIRTDRGSRPTARIRELSEKEKVQRERFRRAVAYAKAKMFDPAAKAEYEQLARRKGFVSAFIAAISDYLKPASMAVLKTQRYTGKVNDPVIVKVNDDLKVASLRVTITRADGTTVEGGSGQFDPTANEWRYLATVDNLALQGTAINAVAVDRLGNEAVAHATL